MFVHTNIAYNSTVVVHGKRAIKTSILCIFRRHKFHANCDYFSSKNKGDAGDEDDSDKAAPDLSFRFSVFFVLHLNDCNKNQISILTEAKEGTITTTKKNKNRANFKFKTMNRLMVAISIPLRSMVSECIYAWGY